MSIPVYPYVPRSASAAPLEIHRLAGETEARALLPHAHLFFELILITAAGGRIAIDGLNYEAHRGSAFVLAPGSVHDLRRLGDADGWAILFQPDTLDASTARGLTPLAGLPQDTLFDLFRQPLLQMLRPISLGSATEHADALVARMHDELRTREPGYVHAVRAALQWLLVTVARCAPLLETARPGVSAAEDLASLVFADIDRHYLGAASLADAASRLGFNEGYLTTRLRKLTGRTYREWVIERRMIEARQMLATTDLAVAAIAQRLRYVEVESFIRRFRARHGITPSAWRRRAHSSGS